MLGRGATIFYIFGSLMKLGTTKLVAKRLARNELSLFISYVAFTGISMIVFCPYCFMDASPRMKLLF